LRKGCLLIFAVNTEGFLASLGMTGLEFFSESFEVCDTKDRLPLAAKFPGVKKLKRSHPFVRSRKRVTHAETRN
jgi:hypothetical protein